MPDKEIQETTLRGKEASCDWIMYLDGAFLLQGAGAGVLPVAPTGEHLKYVIQMHFPREMSTNNTAEYEGLLAGLSIAADLGLRSSSSGVIRSLSSDKSTKIIRAH